MLDCNTPKGREAIEATRRALEIVGYPYVETSQKTDADVDGFFLRGGEISCVFEAKARNMTRKRLINSYHNEWLVTYEKLLKGSAISKSLRVPFVGVVYLTEDNSVLVIKITDDHGNIVVPVRLAVTETQATCNGGIAVRTNAYIKMDSAKVYEG